jgi:hypothetical protein
LVNDQEIDIYLSPLGHLPPPTTNLARKGLKGKWSGGLFWGVDQDIWIRMCTMDRAKSAGIPQRKIGTETIQTGWANASNKSVEGSYDNSFIIFKFLGQRPRNWYLSRDNFYHYYFKGLSYSYSTLSVPLLEVDCQCYPWIRMNKGVFLDLVRLLLWLKPPEEFERHQSG